MSAGSRSVCLCVHVANTVVPGILRLYTCLFRINLSVVQYIFDVSNNHKRCQRSLTGLFCCCWCTNSAGPSICHQQCVVSLLCHLISSGDMIPLCGTLSEWWLAVWLSGNALASINVVALRQTRLVLGWVTVCGRVNHFGM